MLTRDDETLIRAYAQNGDETAFRELVRRYGTLVYAACLREVRRPELAEDAAQAVFLDLARKAGRVRVKTSLVPWLYAASRLAGRNVLRAERRRPTVPLDEAIPVPAETPDDALFQALDALSAPEREAVALRFVQGLSLAEVGETQGVSEDAARMRIQRALKRLRTEYVPAFAAPTGFVDRLATLALPPARMTMNTPLLLTSGGIAAFALTGAATVARRHPEPVPVQAPAPTSVPPPKRTPAAMPPKPEKALPTVPTLDKPFTLVYRMTITDLRTQVVKDAMIAARAKELAAEVDADRKTQAQADAEIAGLRKPSAPKVKEVTLSYDGQTLLYDEPSAGGENDQPNVNLFDGHFSYHFIPGMKNVESQGQRNPGTISYFTWNMPYVGPALPRFPLSQKGKVLNTFAWGRKLIYVNGAMTTGRGGSATRIELGAPRSLSEEIVLSDYTKLQGRLVARKIGVTKRDFYVGAVAPGTPWQGIEYVLVSAKPTALPSERFVPDTYLADGDDFSFVPNANPNASQRFKVDRAKGTLEQQIAAMQRVGS